MTVALDALAALPSPGDDPLTAAQITKRLDRWALASVKHALNRMAAAGRVERIARPFPGSAGMRHVYRARP